MIIQFTLSCMISLMLMMSSHPVAILAIILIQTMLICSLMWTMMKTSWFSFILFLIFLGGLMVLFVYVVSLASNEKFEFNMKTTILYMLSLTVLLMIMFKSMYFQEINITKSSNLMFKSMMMFSFSNLMSSSTIMIYLFFTLVVAVKISSKYEGPLRKMN